MELDNLHNTWSTDSTVEKINMFVIKQMGSHLKKKIFWGKMIRIFFKEKLNSRKTCSPEKKSDSMSK